MDYTIHEGNGQLRVTVPKALADALQLKKGDKIRWLLDRGDLVLRRV